MKKEDSVGMKEMYKKFLKECVNKDQYLLTGEKDYAILLYKELFNNTNHIIRLYSNNNNPEIWRDKEFIKFVNDIILDKNLILNIITTSRTIFDNIFVNNCNVCITETDDNELVSNYFRNNKCEFAVFDDKGYRYEYDTENIKSFANFNNKETAQRLINLFNDILKH